MGRARLGGSVLGGCPSVGASARHPGLTLQSLIRHWITSFRWFRLPQSSHPRAKTQAQISGPPDQPADVPPEFAYPVSVLNMVGTLGPFIQVSCKFKVWFDASVVSLLIQGAPDLSDYGVQGACGLMTRSYASDRVEAYAESSREPWQEGLSYNFVNLHLGLLPGISSAVIPFNTPIFSLYPVLSRQSVRLEVKPA